MKICVIRLSSRLAFGALVVLCAMAGVGATAASGSPPGKVVLLYSVGGLLTEDGTLWQYRPDRSVWMTIDEAFKDQGRTTHILPLPVPAAEIAELETFGFLRTRAGELWLYDLERDRWQKLPPPGPR